MKRLTALFLCALMALSAITFGGVESGTHEAAAAEKVVFFRKGGSGDGSSANSPLGSLTDSYKALGDEGGRLVLCGDYTMPGGFVEPVHTGTVTVTQNYNDIDYRDEGALRTGGTSRRYVLNGPTVFENIRFATTNEQGILIIAQYNPVELGEGIICEGFKGTLVANSLSVIGGNQNGLEPKKVNNTDSSIKIKSGSKILIAGLNRQIDEKIDRTANIEISGGEISMLYGGCLNAGKGRSANITINGGTFTGKMTCEYGLSESVNVTVNGGDFSSCSLITGTAIESKISIAKSVENTVKPLLSGFKTVSTADGVIVNKVPEEVFGADTFTSSDGTKLPYRYYYPEGYDEANADKYPIFVYFHGNGSRGTDNKAQLGATHAIVSRMLNCGTDCVILAPQAPKESAWILNGTYPGGTGHDNTKEPTSKYLSAAIELINDKIADDKIDRDRIYISGGSNGAAACWSLISRNPRTFAAAIIMAGTGATGKAKALAPSLALTPIWTCHGDADSTLSVEGTRQIVNAVEDIGGNNMIYIEYPGRGHDIWVDAANEKGLIDWILSQARTDTVAPLSKVLDPKLIDDESNGSDTSADSEPQDTSPAESIPVVTDKQTPITDDAAGSSADTAAENDGAESDSGNKWLLPALLGASAIAVATVVAVILLKKKKKQ